jgi:hypothetical protein
MPRLEKWKNDGLKGNLEPPELVAKQTQGVLKSAHFAVIDLARLDARRHVNRLNAAAMALSARMRAEPGARVSLAVDFVRNTVRVNWSPKEMDAVSNFYFAYQKFTEAEGLKLRRKLRMIENMRFPIPKSVLLRNPLVQFGIEKGRHQGEIDLVLDRMLFISSRRSGAEAR